MEPPVLGGTLLAVSDLWQHLTLVRYNAGLSCGNGDCTFVEPQSGLKLLDIAVMI